MSVPDTVRHHAREVVFESYPVCGFNDRMTDMQAAIGRRQLQRLPHILARRRALAASYARRLAEIPGVQPPHEPEWTRPNWQSYCIRLPDGADQARVMQAMLDRGVATRRGIMCAHLEGAHADLEAPPLPRSEEAHRRAILLPLYPQMTDAEQTQVVDALQAALAAETADGDALRHVA
jgi:dTDP-4-amino-4,6-dideoxygalactose transaminase